MLKFNNLPVCSAGDATFAESVKVELKETAQHGESDYCSDLGKSVGRFLMPNVEPPTLAKVVEVAEGLVETDEALQGYEHKSAFMASVLSEVIEEQHAMQELAKE